MFVGIIKFVCSSAESVGGRSINNRERARAHTHTHTHTHTKSAVCKLINKKEDPHFTECHYLENVPCKLS